MVMLSPVRSDAPSSVTPSASFVVDALWECPEPPVRLLASMDRLRGVCCLTIFNHYRFFSFDSNVSVLKPKTPGIREGKLIPPGNPTASLKGLLLERPLPFPHLSPAAQAQRSDGWHQR